MTHRCHKLDSMGILAGHNSVVFKELATESVIMLQRVYEQHKLDLGFFFFFFFVGGVTRVGGADLTWEA